MKKIQIKRCLSLRGYLQIYNFYTYFNGDYYTINFSYWYSICVNGIHRVILQ